LLKNVLLTALSVIGATMATSAVAVIGFFLLMTGDNSSSASALLQAGPAIATVAAIVGGFLFAPVSLLVAATTMPPALGLARAFSLPRPAFDIAGGAVAGLVTAQLCAMIFLEAMASLARSKGGEPPDAADTLIFFAAFGVLGGAVLGWLRHGAMKKHQAGPASPPIYQKGLA
jgi:hypothetical protein